MAKRVPKDDKPYRPLEESLVRSVLAGQSAGGAQTAVAIAEPPPPESSAKPQPETADRRPTPRVVRPEPEPELERRPTPRPATVAEALPEKRDREKRMLLTRAEERDVERLVDRLANELGTSVKLSHVLRAYMMMLLHAEDEVLERARKSPGLIRPGNGNAPELAEFEKGLAQVLIGAFRDAPAIR